MEEKEIYIKITKNGPYLVYGIKKITLKYILCDENGYAVKYKNGTTFEIKMEPQALCRCGKSKDAPYCDGMHVKMFFDGTLNAPLEPILKNAKTYIGPNLILKDNEKYCASARFCDKNCGIWDFIMESDNKIKKELAIEEANACPAGRLIIFDKNGQSYEANLNKSLELLEDNWLKISGPIWVKGGIRIENEDGLSYEIRNRQTICRCGASKNKPFCDGSHVKNKFKAEYKNIKKEGI